MPTENQ